MTDYIGDIDFGTMAAVVSRDGRFVVVKVGRSTVDALKSGQRWVAFWSNDCTLIYGDTVDIVDEKDSNAFIRLVCTDIFEGCGLIIPCNISIASFSN